MLLTLPTVILATTLLAEPHQGRINELLLPDAPNPCEQCSNWNRPHPAVHIFGNTWWVGVQGLSVIAIDTGAGVILLDGALPQSTPLVKANLVTAGLKLSGV